MALLLQMRFLRVTEIVEFEEVFVQEYSVSKTAQMCL
jgi:hypothetical protein